MDRSQAETKAVELAAAKALEQRTEELDALQLALVGGGIADPIL